MSRAAKQSGRTGSASRNNFLQRGQREQPDEPLGTSPLPPQLAVGPSVVFDEETGTAAPAASLPVSQLFTQPGAAPFTRQRPRFHSVQDLDLALNQAIEGRITSKNAWASKEASDLLEGIAHTISSTLDANSADDYSGFTKAATVVEGCSKVWTVRVDSTYHQSSQMLQRLLRNEETGAGADGGEGGEDGDGTGGADGGGGGRRRNARAAAAAATAARTLALNAAEINLDGKARTALTQTGVNAQFRAITEKFDQGNAQGLLLSNAPLGSKGNVILDVDYAQVEGQFSARRARQARNSGTGGEEEEEATTTAATSPRHSLRVVEEDAEVDAAPDDLPDLAAVVDEGAVSAAASQRPSGRPTASGSGGALDELLVLPHAAMKQELAVEGQSRRPSGERPSSSGSGMDTAAAAAMANVEGEEGGYGDDDYGGGADWGDDYGDGDDDDAGGGAAADVGLAARQLVSGLTELRAVDAYLDHHRREDGDDDGDDAGERPSAMGGMYGGVQLALEAEDPSSWCPLTDASTNPLAGMAPHSELSKLRRQHRVAAGGADGVGSGSSAAGGGGASSAASGAAAGAPAAKRTRREKTVVFDLSVVKDLDASAATSSGIFALDKADVDGSALKQSTTATKNVTPLGREILLGKDAGSAVLAYVQSGFQRTRAEQAGLVLPADPVPGSTIPEYLAFPVTINGFFQPFSTTQPGWNLLRKSAAGHIIGRPSAHGGRASVLAGGPAAEDAGRNGEEEMPVAFFAGGAEVDDMDGGGYEGDDFYVHYGGDGGGDDGDMDENDRDGEYRRAELQLLRQLDAHHQQQQQQQQQLMAEGGAAASLAASARNSGEFLSSMDPLELVKMLQSPEAVLPTQVDVVALRKTMWALLQELAGISAETRGAGDVAAGKRKKGLGEAEEGRGEKDDEEGEEEEEEEEALPRNKESVLKSTALRLLNSSQRRKKARGQAKTATGGPRDGRGGGNEDEEDEEENAAAATRNGRKRGRSSSPSSSSSSSSTDDDDDDDEGDAGKKREGDALLSAFGQWKDGNLRFSDVVEALLPHISSISSTGTLSPAFFFFSILFLANEHSIVLKNVETLDDLIIDAESLVTEGGGVITRQASPKRRRTGR